MHEQTSTAATPRIIRAKDAISSWAVAASSAAWVDNTAVVSFAEEVSIAGDTAY